MKENEKKLSRRDFLSQTTGAAIAGAAGISAGCGRFKSAPDEPPKPKQAATKIDAEPEKSDAAEGKRSEVVLVRDENVLKEGNKTDPAIIARMLDDAVAALFEKPADDAWKDMFGPADIVGVKSNEWRFLATPKELEDAIRVRLLDVGVKEENMSVDDRDIRSNPVFEKATALVNVRPMRTHHWAGVGSLIKNYILFSAAPFTWHADSCANLGGIWDMPEVKGKTRLNILVMLTPLFHGKGPHHFQAKYTWPYKGLIVSTDPVAADAVGVAILDAKRREYFGKDEPLVVSPKHIRVAETRYRLGVSELDRIDIKKVGWMDGAFV
jgi:hypothetical protein